MNSRLFYWTDRVFIKQKSLHDGNLLSFIYVYIERTVSTILNNKNNSPDPANITYSSDFCVMLTCQGSTGAVVRFWFSNIFWGVAFLLSSTKGSRQKSAIITIFILMSDKILKCLKMLSHTLSSNVANKALKKL